MPSVYFGLQIRSLALVLGLHLTVLAGDAAYFNSMPSHSFGVGRLGTMTLSDDGTLLAIGNTSGSISIFRSDTQELVGTLQVHRAEITHLEFWDDGKQLLSSSDDGMSLIWNVDDRRKVRVFVSESTQAGHTSLLSHSEEELVEVHRTWEESILTIRKIEDGTELLRLPLPFGGRKTAFRFNPISNQIAIAELYDGSSCAGSLEILDLDRRELYQSIQLNCLAYSFDYSPDGKFLTVFTDGDGIQVRDASTGQLVQTWRQEGVHYRHGGYLPTGREIIVSAGVEEGVREVSSLFSVDTVSGGVTQQWSLPKSSVGPLVVAKNSPIFTTLGTGQLASEVKFWRREAENELGTIVYPKELVSEIRINESGAIVGLATRLDVSIWDWDTGRMISLIRPHRSLSIGAFDLSRDGERFVTGSRSILGGGGAVEVWSREGARLAHFQRSASFEDDGQGIDAVAFDSISQDVVFAGTSRVLGQPSGFKYGFGYRWNPENDEVKWALEPASSLANGIDGAPTAIAVWPSTSKFLLGLSPRDSFSGPIGGSFIEIRSMDDGQLIETLESSFSDGIKSIQFDESGRHFLVLDGDGEASVWRSADLSRIHLWNDDIDRVVLSTDGNRVLLGNELLNRAMLFDLAENRTLAEVPFGGGGLAIVPKLDSVVTGTDNGTAFVWPTLSSDNLANLSRTQISTGIAFANGNVGRSWIEIEDPTSPSGFSVQSPIQGEKQSSWFGGFIDGPGILSYSVKRSLLRDEDYLEFFIDDVAQERLTGEFLFWDKREHSIPSGRHELRWQLSNNTDLRVEEVTNTAWIGDIQWSPGLQITVELSAGEGGTTVPSGMVELNDFGELTIEAIADPGYLFLGWYENNERLSSNTVFELSVKEERALEALFRYIGPEPGRELTKHEYAIRSLALHPSEPRLVSGDNRGNLKVWDLTTGIPVFEVDETTVSIWTDVNVLKYSPTGDYYYSGTDEGRLVARDSHSNALLWDEMLGSQVHSVDTAENGDRLLVGTKESFVIVDAETGNIARTYTAPNPGTEYLAAFAYDDSKALVTFGSLNRDERLGYLIDLESAEVVEQFPLIGLATSALALLDSGQRLLSDGKYLGVQVDTLSPFNLHYFLSDQTLPLLVKNGSVILTSHIGSRDLSAWDSDTGAAIDILPGTSRILGTSTLKEGLSFFTAREDLSVIAVGRWDGSIGVWSQDSLSETTMPKLDIVRQSPNLILRVRGLTPGGVYSLEWTEELDNEWNEVQTFTANVETESLSLTSLGFYRIKRRMNP